MSGGICYFYHNRQPMIMIYLILGMNVLLVFSFKRGWLLNRTSYLILLLFNLLLFISSYLFQHYFIGDPRFSVLLKVPLLYQLLFLPCYGFIENYSIQIRLIHSGPWTLI
jgi:hypothetical protein